MYTGYAKGGQTSYGDMPVAYPGMFEGLHARQNSRLEPYANIRGTVEIHTVGIPATVDASTTYKIVIDGIESAFETGGATTQDELGQGLFNALRQNYLLRGVDFAYDAATDEITITTTGIGVNITVTVNDGDTTNDLTVTPPGTPAARGTEIGYGLFVARKTSDYLHPAQGVGVAALPDNATDKIVGATVAAGYHEKVGMGEEAVDAYRFDAVMDVAVETGSHCFWVQVVDTDLAAGATPYVAVSGADKGKLTSNSSGTIDISSYAKVRSAAQKVRDGLWIAKVALRDFPMV